MESICGYGTSESDDEEYGKKGTYDHRESTNYPRRPNATSLSLDGNRKRAFAEMQQQEKQHEVSKEEGQVVDPSIFGGFVTASQRNFPTTSYEGSISCTNKESNTLEIKRYVSKRERKCLEERYAKEKMESLANSNEDKLQLTNDSKVPQHHVSNTNHSKPPKKVVVQLDGHAKCANAVRWNKHHVFLLMSCGMDQCVKLWNVFERKTCVLNLTFHQQAVKDARWTLDGRHGLSCGYDKTARLWDAEKGQELQQFKHKDFVTSLQIHPTDSNIFLTGSFNSGIQAWDIRNNQFISRYEAPFGQVQDLVFINENEFISAAEVLRRNSIDKGIMAWDFKSTAILSNQIYQEAYTCTCLKVHPYESNFMAQSNGDYIAIFSSKRPYKLNKYKRFEGHTVSGYHIGFDISADGTLVGSGSSDGSIFFYNYQTSKVIRTMKSHTAACSDLAIHPVLPSTVASCSWDGSVLIWE